MLTSDEVINELAYLNRWLDRPGSGPRIEQWLKERKLLLYEATAESRKLPGWFSVDRVAVTTSFVEFRFHGDVSAVGALVIYKRGLYIGGMMRRPNDDADVEVAVTVEPGASWSLRSGICDPAAFTPWVVARAPLQRVTLQTNHPAKAATSSRPCRPDYLKGV